MTLPDPAAVLGLELRRGRQSLDLRQRDLADRIGCSQATISRLELGGGAGYSLGLWSAVAIGIDHLLRVELLPRDPSVRPPVSLALQSHRTVAAAARQGGWAAETEVLRTATRERIVTVLARGPERVLVHAWDVVAEVDDRIVRLEEELALHHQPAPGPPIRGLVIVPATYNNRRRATEAREVLAVHLPSLGARWFAALLNPAAPLPNAAGMLVGRPLRSSTPARTRGPGMGVDGARSREPRPHATGNVNWNVEPAPRRLWSQRRPP